MSHRIGVVLMVVLMLGGAQGCSGLRAFVVAELAEELGYNFRALDAKTRKLEAEIAKFREEAERRDSEMAILVDMATEVEDQLTTSKKDVYSIEDSIKKYEDKIQELSRAPLEEGETEAEREEKIADFKEDLHFNKGRLAATKNFLKELERTVDITNERLNEHKEHAENVE